MNQVYPYLQKLQPEVIRSQMVKICGVGESQVEDKILDLIDKQQNPTIATYAKTGEVHIRVTAKAATEEDAKKLVKPVVKEIKNRFGDYVYSTKEEETLEQAVVRLLKKYELTVTTAGVLHRWTAGWPHHQCAGSFRGLQRGFYHIFQ